MKKLFLLAGIALLSLNVSAQEESKGLEGTWWVAVKCLLILRKREMLKQLQI